MQQLVILLVINCSSTCFRRLYAHHQEVRLCFTAYGFLSCCSCCDVGESVSPLFTRRNGFFSSVGGLGSKLLNGYQGSIVRVKWTENKVDCLFLASAKVKKLYVFYPSTLSWWGQSICYLCTLLHHK